MNIAYLLFAFVYLYFCNWVRIMGSVGNLMKSYSLKNSVEKLKKPTLIAKYKIKTGINFDIRIVKSNKIFAAMARLPLWPAMIISSFAMDELSESELDWIICHEAGHCIKWHLLIVTGFQITIFIIGLLIINNFNLPYLSSIFLAILLGLLFFQCERYFSEYKADLYALQKVDSLDGMIRANEKMKKHWTKNAVYRNKVLMFLITPHLHYDTRIKMAKSRMLAGK